MGYKVSLSLLIMLSNIQEDLLPEVRVLLVHYPLN